MPISCARLTHVDSTCKAHAFLALDYVDRRRYLVGTTQNLRACKLAMRMHVHAILAPCASCTYHGS